MTIEYNQLSKLTTREAAPLVGVTPKTLREWRYLGKGPPYEKPEGAVRYKFSALMKWLEEGTVTAAK